MYFLNPLGLEMPVSELLPPQSQSPHRPLHVNLLPSSLLFSITFSWLVVSQLHADDWPQFKGVHRDNKSAETGLLAAWPENGPALAWSFKNAGLGYSSPSIVKDRIYLTGGRNGRAELFCLDSNDF